MATNALYCYICGCGFGSSSLARHFKACEAEFKNEQKFLPLRLQIKVPNPPTVPQPPDLSL
jgi:hypothetical protein